ncbi:glycosyltransferase family 2 protein [Selenomonas ruminantium]|uniref:Glycosyl transferase family 2 n=1 Tax=Selenomonas ruminantium TaxID=971 RepID=A0A1H0NYI2_SELRU|nr:glycosyltransferase family 2 protein [Selenomonas ruminantium]SDO97842.1 Glycosyl transferase family 2 [Selenomonas ruminantium]
MSYMTEKPLVSILIPVYNREDLIRPCIESALEQTYENTEIIVVDNKSTDNTWNVVKEYARNYPKVKAFQNEENIGPVRNWLSCMNHATGKLGKILFSDDLMYETYLEKTVPLLTDNVSLVFSMVEIGEGRGQGNVSYRYKERTCRIESREFLRDSLLSKLGLVSPGAALFRLSDLRKNLRYGDNVIPSPTIYDFDRHGAGPDLWLYLAAAGQYDQVAYVDEVLCLFRAHPGSISIMDSKLQYLDKCYFQARIAYCEERMPEMTEAVLCRRWMKDLKKTKKIISFRKWANSYVQNGMQYEVSVSLVIKSLIEWM